MANRRATKKAGILKPRLLKADKPEQLNRALDAIIERIEVLDGIRGDNLDRAVTYRDLRDVSGFGISFGGGLGGGGGSPIIDTTPGPAPGQGLGEGPADPPTNLTATGGFLSIILSWDNAPYYLQHNEIWRSTEDNLSTAILLATSVTSIYVDYVGGDEGYYYWVRSLGTDGTYSAYNDTAGTFGQALADPSEWEQNITVSRDMLDAALSSTIDLIDNPTTGLLDRIDVVEGDIVAQDAEITSLQSSVNGLNTTTGNNTAAISANASLIQTNSTSITDLSGQLDTVELDIVSLEQGVAANSNSILELEATIGTLDSGGGQDWAFTSDLEGFTVANASLTGPTNGAAIFVPSAANPQLISPTVDGGSVSGSIYTQVVVRLRQTIGGSTWEGKLYYQTDSHGFSESYYKILPDPGLTLSQWTILTWDMTDLTIGGTDWVNSNIKSLRLDLVSDANGRFEIDYILIAKFSTSAISSAIEALDVRVVQNENDITAQGTQLTNLSAEVTNAQTNITTNADAISALTVTVNDNAGDITANAQAITSLEVNKVDANATAIQSLETEVSNITGDSTSYAQSITQLTASVVSGSASIINTLGTAGEDYATSFLPGEIDEFTAGGRTFVGGSMPTSALLSRRIDAGYTGQRIKIEPNAIYEVRMSLYDFRGVTDNGSFYVLVGGYTDAPGTTQGIIDSIRNGAVTSSGINPYILLSQNDTAHANEWFDIVFYVLGSNVDIANCPNMSVNGLTDNSQGFGWYNDAIRVREGVEYIRLNINNYNASPSWGDDNQTTLYVTNVSMWRTDATVQLTAAIQEEATVRASETGDLSALYAVKADLSGTGTPYIAGFGLAANLINGVPSSAFAVYADQFYVADPSDPDNTKAAPFVVDTLANQIYLDGVVIEDGTITAQKLGAFDVTATNLTVANLATISEGKMGTLTSGLIRTAASPSWRTEIEDTAGSNLYPIWYGEGVKGGSGSRFWLDAIGNVYMRGLLDAGMIKQTYFTPAVSTTFDAFKIACDYTSVGHPSYSSGSYTGKKAQLFPRWSTGYNTNINVSTSPTSGVKVDGVDKFDSSNAWVSSQGRFYSPTNTSSVEWRRLGTLNEILTVKLGAQFSTTNNGYYHAIAVVEYRYNSAATWRTAGYVHGVSGFYTSAVTTTGAYTFATRNAAFSTLDFRLRCYGYGSGVNVYLQNASLTVEGSNMGTSDIASVDITDITGTVPGNVNSADFDGKIYRLV